MKINFPQQDFIWRQKKKSTRGAQMTADIDAHTHSSFIFKSISIAPQFLPEN